MEIVVNINKSLQENAAVYFEKAKKAKRKIVGAKKALEDTKRKIEDAQVKADQEQKDTEHKKQLKERKKEWYEKFRWFISSEGMLVVGGRDATTNEIVIKKHTHPGDLVFHTEASGSPFFVIQSEGNKIGEQTIKETATAAASFSKAWKLGLTAADIFYVNPEQVTKEAQAGEYISKGAFMIRGDKNIMQTSCEIVIGITKEGAIMSGPESAVKTHCEKYVKIKQGTSKTSDIAKRIQKKLGGDLDEIIRAIPEGSELA